jgi:hypothetical protein
MMQRRIPMTLELPTHNRHILRFYGFLVNPAWLKEFGGNQDESDICFRPFANDNCMIAYVLQLVCFVARIDTLPVMYELECVRNFGGVSPDPPEIFVDRVGVLGGGPQDADAICSLSPP